MKKREREEVKEERGGNGGSSDSREEKQGARNLRTRQREKEGDRLSEREKVVMREMKKKRER